jgi:hypothetical protein
MRDTLPVSDYGHLARISSVDVEKICHSLSTGEREKVPRY